MKKKSKNYITFGLFLILLFGAFSYTQKARGVVDPVDGKYCWGYNDHMCCKYGTGNCMHIYYVPKKK